MTVEETFDSQFKFKPGDLVVARTHVEALKIEAALNGPKKRRYGRVGSPRSGYVIVRLLEQCHGGTQGFYLVAERDENGHQTTTRYPEHAVVALSEAVEAMRLNIEPEKDDGDDFNAWEQAAGVLLRDYR